MQNFLINTVIEAGNILIKSKKDLTRSVKKDGSILTSADLKSNTYLIKKLSETKIPIISEELNKFNYNERKDLEKYWLIDPLDGTKEYVNNSKNYTVNIALMENSIPIIGVISSPENQTIYYGDIKKNELKVYRNKTKKISKINLLDLKKTNAILVSKSHISIEKEIIKSKYDDKISLIKMGSSIKFCLVATGEYQGYFRSGPTMEWDIAAGVAICNSVGLTVRDIDTNQEVLFNKKSLKNSGFYVIR